MLGSQDSRSQQHSAAARIAKPQSNMYSEFAARTHIRFLSMCGNDEAPGYDVEFIVLCNLPSFPEDSTISIRIHGVYLYLYLDMNSAQKWQFEWFKALPVCGGAAFINMRVCTGAV